MGLDIRGFGAEKEYHYGYHILHNIRYLALRVDGYKGTWMDFNKANDNKEWHWLKHPNFWQLLHFCDAEGVMVPESYLEGIEYKDSFYLGNTNKLLAELEVIKEAVARHPEEYKDLALEPFWTLYDVVKETVEEGRGVIVLS